MKYYQESRTRRYIGFIVLFALIGAMVSSVLPAEWAVIFALAYYASGTFLAAHLARHPLVWVIGLVGLVSELCYQHNLEVVDMALTLICFGLAIFMAQHKDRTDTI